MKHVMLIGEGIADDPLEELKGRTPLDAAKTPSMDSIAPKARMGLASWLPASLGTGPDVALFSILGYDPMEFYTGIAPVEGAAAGLEVKDSQIAFRCDFVTVADDKLADAQAGRISPNESKPLLEELQKKLGKSGVRFHAGDGFRNFVLFDDPTLAEALDDTECLPPADVLGKAVSRSWPKGGARKALIDLMKASRDVLENHEINRVRIDLNENPASMIWLWGQGRRPKVPSFQQKHNLEGSFGKGGLFLKGFASLLGLKEKDGFEASAWKDFHTVYYSRESADPADFKAKVRSIEEFDAKVLAPALQAVKKSGKDTRIYVVSDGVQSTPQGRRTHAHAPYMVYGPGIEGQGLDSFCEKNCAQGGLLTDPGHGFLASFLKG